MRINLGILWGIFFCGLGALHAQDPVFSQFYAAPLQLNPAIVGISELPRVTTNYRNQWPAWPNAYRTYALAYEQPLPVLNGGLGISALGDDAGNGVYRTVALNLVYSYYVQLTADYFVKFGIEGGLLQTRIDWDKFVFGDQLDPITGAESPGGGILRSEEQRPESLQKSVADFGAGLMVHSRKVYAGVAIRHLNRPDERLWDVRDNLRVGRPMRLSLHAGWEIGFAQGNNLRYPAFISPNIQLIRQADFTQINAGAYLGYNFLFGGLWYRQSGKNPDALIALVGFREGVLRFGYSFDVTLSALGLARTGGTHEISLGINFADSYAAMKRKRSTRLNNCFNMFR